MGPSLLHCSWAGHTLPYPYRAACTWRVSLPLVPAVTPDTDRCCWAHGARLPSLYGDRGVGLTTMPGQRIAFQDAPQRELHGYASSGTVADDYTYPPDGFAPYSIVRARRSTPLTREPAPRSHRGSALVSANYLSLFWLRKTLRLRLRDFIAHKRPWTPTAHSKNLRATSARSTTYRATAHATASAAVPVPYRPPHATVHWRHSSGLNLRLAAAPFCAPPGRALPHTRWLCLQTLRFAAG